MHIRRTLNLVTILFIGLVLFFATPSQAHANAQNVAGHIYFAGTSTPVTNGGNGVWVKWQDRIGHIRYARTDANGYYFFASWQGQTECSAWEPESPGSDIYNCTSQRILTSAADREAEYGTMIDTDFNGSDESRKSNHSGQDGFGCDENTHSFSVVQPWGWGGTFSSSQAAISNTTINTLTIDMFYSPDESPPTGSITIDRQFAVRYSSIESTVRITGNVSATSPGTVGAGIYAIRANGDKIGDASCPSGVWAGKNCELAYSAGQSNISLSYDWTPQEYEPFYVFVAGSASYGRYCSGNPTVTIPGTYGGLYFVRCGPDRAPNDPSDSAFIRAIYPPNGSITASSTSTTADVPITFTASTFVNSPATVGSLGVYVVNTDGSKITTCASGVFAGNNCLIGTTTSSNSSTASISRPWTPTNPGSYFAFLTADDNWSGQYSFHCSGNPKATLPGPYGPYYFYKCDSSINASDWVFIAVGAVPVPTLGAMSFGAGTGAVAAGQPKTVGRRSNDSGNKGSNYYNPLEITQTLDQAYGTNVNLVGFAFVNTSSSPTNLSELKAAADSGSGFVVVYANCASPTTCTSIAGQSFTAGHYYFYRNGWTDITNKIPSNIYTYSPDNTTANDWFQINATYTQTQSVTQRVTQRVTDPKIQIRFFPAVQNKTWATYGYVYSTSGEATRRTN